MNSPTIEELMTATLRLNQAIFNARQAVVQFVTAPSNNHPEGDAWFSVLETNLACAHQNLNATVEGLKDCRFDRSALHAKMAAACIFNCRFITHHILEWRTNYIPDEYLRFFKDSDDTFSQLNGHVQLVPVQIKEKMK